MNIAEVEYKNFGMLMITYLRIIMDTFYHSVKKIVHLQT